MIKLKNICNMEGTKYNNDVPYERVVLRVLENYSKMQIKLTRYQKKVKEGSPFRSGHKAVPLPRRPLSSFYLLPSLCPDIIINFIS